MISKNLYRDDINREIQIKFFNFEKKNLFKEFLKNMSIYFINILMINQIKTHRASILKTFNTHAKLKIIVK